MANLINASECNFVSVYVRERACNAVQVCVCPADCLFACIKCLAFRQLQLSEWVNEWMSPSAVAANKPRQQLQLFHLSTASHEIKRPWSATKTICMICQTIRTATATGLPSGSIPAPEASYKIWRVATQRRPAGWWTCNSCKWC